MAKRIDYAALYTLRSDGRYMGYWHDSNKRRHAIYDRDRSACTNASSKKKRNRKM